MIGDIMTISRLRMGTDGKGVSTLITFFDCLLHCKYCINDFCHENIDNDVPRASYTPEELVRTLEKDDIYYRMSGDGIVFGGGEPLLQSAFIHEVCKLADPSWKKRIETSLNVPWRYVEPVTEDFDEWIIDVKDMNLFVYKDYTGRDNINVINNMNRLKDILDISKFHIRIPWIPEFSDDEKIRDSIKRIIDILGYGVKIEEFDYIVPPEIKRHSWWDEIEDEDEEQGDE